MARRKIVFTGAGCNDSRLLRAVMKSLDSPSKETVPAGATWPFVTLEFDGQTATFALAHIKKKVKPADTKLVRLSILGYVYFETKDGKNDFGFATLKVNGITKELQERGYKLDNSFQRNRLIAKSFLIFMALAPFAIMALVGTMSILKPHG